MTTGKMRPGAAAETPSAGAACARPRGSSAHSASAETPSAGAVVKLSQDTQSGRTRKTSDLTGSNPNLLLG